MTELYAHKWETANGQIGGHMFHVWRKDLAGVSLDRIKDALDVIAETKPEWPPSLITFLRLCDVRSEPSHQKLQIEHSPPCSQSVAQEHLNKMRAAAGMPPKELPAERIKRRPLLT